MSDEIELLRNNLEKLIIESESLVDSEVIFSSQKLDKLIVKYQLSNA
jgi:hypothetical protein